MPPISMLLGDTRVSEMNVVLKKAVMSGEEILNPAITWNYGCFFKILWIS